MAVLPQISTPATLAVPLRSTISQRALESTVTPTSPANQGEGLTHDEIIAIISTLVGFITLVIAVATLVYAIKTMQDAKNRNSENIWRKLKRWFACSKR